MYLSASSLCMSLPQGLVGTLLVSRDIKYIHKNDTFSVQLRLLVCCNSPNKFTNVVVFLEAICGTAAKISPAVLISKRCLLTGHLKLQRFEVSVMTASIMKF